MDKAKISAIILLLITIAIVFSFNFDVTTVHDADQSLLYVNESSTLSPTEQGITSSSLYALNNSYLEFDGVNDYVNLTGFNWLIFNDTTNFTYSLWINPKVCGNGTSTYISGLVGGYQRNAIGLDADCRIVGGLRNSTYNSDSSYSTPTNSIKINSWNYVLASYNANTKNYTIYINGVLQLNKTLAVTNVTDDNGAKSNTIAFYRNVPAGTPVFYNGLIDDVRIYNRTLSDSEITEIYNSGRYKNTSLPSDGLVLYMPFEETNGSVIYDNSGNNNNGELIYE